MIQIVGRCIAAEVKREKRRVTSGKIPGWRPLAPFLPLPLPLPLLLIFRFEREKNEEEEVAGEEDP
jgi:hypothetical protein